MRLTLEVISGPKAGQKIVAQAGQVVRIGRTSKAAVAMEDTFMSGEHFAIECVGGACGVRDLDSRNGTKLNDEKITRAVLHDGDRIHAGQTDFVAHVEADEGPPDQSESLLKATLPPMLPPTRSEKAVLSGQPIPLGQTPVGPLLTPKVEGSSGLQQEIQPVPQGPRVNNARPENRRETMDSRSQSPLDQAMLSYEAATPEGTLLRILQNQPGNLMALVDATRDRRVLELLHNSSEEYRSLYQGDQNLAVAPHLVRLPHRSSLLTQVIREGWGRSWGVFLSCNVSLAELREYFRSALMVSMPDGTEMFSRFYDPRFFRGLLESCTVAEALRFFGPIGAYLMESDRPEILLEFTRGGNGTEKKGHLLTPLE
jgi:hypothetical protein